MPRLPFFLLALLICATVVPAFAVDPTENLSSPGSPGAVPPPALFKEGARAKLSTDLVQLVDPAARLSGQTRASVVRGIRDRGALRGTPGTRGPGAEEIFVYVSVIDGSRTGEVDPLVRRVANRDEEHGVVAAWVATDRLIDLASQPFVRSVRTVDPPQVNAGSVTTEGDALILAERLRSTLGHAGQGVRIGVISDGVDSWREALDTGDLPGDLHVLSNRQGGDEGTAMLEIVHDIAPEADLYFHDMSNNQIGFNEGITALVNAGCRVIVDDISYLAEPAFEDGLIASHVDHLVAERGILYVSSAANFANAHYQGRFRPEPGTNIHDFSVGSETEFRRLYLSLPASSGAYAIVILHWDDPWGASSNDYDLAIHRRGDPLALLAVSDNAQLGNGNPIEFAVVYAEADEEMVVEVNVTRFSGEPRTLEVFVVQRGAQSLVPVNLVEADSIFGHPAAHGAIAVAAADVATPWTLEPYSSRGPVTIRWPAPEVRQKPEIAGPDGNLISGAGGWGFRDGAHYRFYGTSSSAPHVAALAALAWSGRPTATAAEVRSALLSTAQDRGPAGFDYGWGHGWPDALALARALGLERLSGPGGGAPRAAFGVTTQSGPAPLALRFLDYSSGAVTWHWDFGDGTSTAEHEPLHTYALPGRYTVSLTVTGSDGTTSTATRYDCVVATGPGPTPSPTVSAHFTANETGGPAPLEVQFSDASTGSPVHWWWQFGDGASSTEKDPVHTYTIAGTYTVNLTVWSGNGSATASRPGYVTVGPDPRAPVAHFNLSREFGPAPLYVRFSDASENATSWRWDFGGLAWTTAPNPSVVFRRPGTYEVSLTAKNRWGASVSTSTVTVTGEAVARANEPPIVVVA
ncbi:PKD domain protein [anaerobic digester metagenome]